jgi:phage shock protein B
LPIHPKTDLETAERIMTAENPNWKQQCVPGRERDNQRLLADGE